MMKLFATYKRNISLLLCGGLILTFYSMVPISPKKVKKVKQVTIKTQKAPAKSTSVPKPAPVPFSFYNDVVTPLFPALKI